MEEILLLALLQRRCIKYGELLLLITEILPAFPCRFFILQNLKGGKNVQKNITLEQAQNQLLGLAKIMGDEQINIIDAVDRILSIDIRASENIPPFAKSAFDGYAFRAEDIENASEDKPVRLKVLEEIPAGYAPSKKIVPGTTIKVMTGAPIPEGANAVTKYELVERIGEEIEVKFSCKSGDNIVMPGEDVKIGQKIIAEKTNITPPVVGILASLGFEKVPVFKKPTVAIISTGDELIEIDEPLRPAKIRNSNQYSLYAYIKALGAEPISIGIAKDKIGEVQDYIEKGLENADIVITTGGVSVGDYDVLEEALRLMGAEILFHGIDIKPGSPTLAARINDKLVLCLSGNPASAMVVFQVLAAPLIQKMAGRRDYLLEKIEGILVDDFPKDSPKRRLLRGALLLENGNLSIKLTGDQRNAALSSMIGCNIIADVPAGSEPLNKGVKLNAYVVDKIEKFFY